jgi:hypothetical protein
MEAPHRQQCRPAYNPSMQSMSDAFRTTLDLFATGVDLMRQNLRRQHPHANEDAIDHRLRQWLLDRPGAEYGDSPGRPVDVSDRRE